jgi:hypothetical protein
MPKRFPKEFQEQIVGFSGQSRGCDDRWDLLTSKRTSKIADKWAARVSIPAPWECFQKVRVRASPYIFVGWTKETIRQRA